MSEPSHGDLPKVLCLATTTCAYPGADAAGQGHLEYPSNAVVVMVPSPALFPEEFYYRAFEKGIGGIIVMACGEECPYEGAFERLAERLGRVNKGLKERGINTKRLKLTAICTVCTKPFIREINQMNDLLASEVGT